MDGNLRADQTGLIEWDLRAASKHSSMFGTLRARSAFTFHVARIAARRAVFAYSHKQIQEELS